MIEQKIILYLISAEKFNRVFGHFPERSNIKQVVLLPYNCNEAKYFIKDVRKLPKHKDKKTFSEITNKSICEINPDVLVQASLIDFAPNYKGKRVFVSHGIAHADLINPRADKFDLFCIGGKSLIKGKLKIPERKILMNSMPQFDLLRRSHKPNKSEFNNTILYAPSLVSNSKSPIVKVKPKTIFENIIKLAEDAKKYNYLIKISFKGKLHQDFKTSFNKKIREASKYVHVIDSKAETIYDHYYSSDLVLVDEIDTTVIMESHILNKTVTIYSNKIDLLSIINNSEKYRLFPSDDDVATLGNGLAHDRVFNKIIKEFGINLGEISK